MEKNLKEYIIDIELGQVAKSHKNQKNMLLVNTTCTCLPEILDSKIIYAISLKVILKQLLLLIE